MRKSSLKRPARSATFLLFPALLLMSLISCKKDKEEETVTLTFTSWRVEDVAAMDRINGIFTASHPHIRISFEPVDVNIYDSVTRSRLAAGNGADILFLRSYDGGRKMYDEGYLYDLTGVIPNLGAFAPLVVNAWSSGSVTYGLPSVGVTHGIYYQKSKFQEYGLQEPATWEEFIADCDTLLAHGETVLAQGALTAWTLYEIVYSGLGANFYGGETARQGLISGTMKLTDANFLAAFNMVNSLEKYFPAGYENQSYESLRQLFATGGAAMFPGGSWEISTFRDLGADLSDIGWFAPPVVHAGDKLQYCFHVDAGIGVNKHSGHPGQALEYLKWLAGTEYSQALMNELPGFFSYTPGSASPVNALAQKMFDASSTADLTVRLMCEKLSAQEPAGNTLMGTALVGMLKDEYTPEEAAAYVQSQLDTWYHP